MIGTDEMSSTGMDISESFRAEDLSKTDFFDFVTAPDMGIGIGVGVGVDVDVGVGLHAHHHHQQQQQQQQQQHHHHSPALTNMTHDGGGGGGADSRCGGGGSGAAVVNDGNSTGNSSDPTLQAYEFWHTEKEHSRLDTTIFEDLDRYCWQQQQQQHSQPAPNTASASHHHSPNNAQHPAHNTPNPHSPNQHQQQQQQSQQHQQRRQLNACSQHSTPSSIHNSSNHNNNNSNSSHGDTTDGQIYTITVLNGNEPWLKREPEQQNAAQLPSTLDLDSLLGSFPGYIKSEYPYDDSAGSFSNVEGPKDESSLAAGDMVNGMGMSSATSGHAGGLGISQRLPSLVTAISIASGNGATSQHMAQFQNNNNDWHMADHNAEQNSAESLLRSALQGKGYSKGLHMQNGLTLLPNSPTVKEDDMRRMLFPGEADPLSFADSTLNAAQMFDDTQNAHLVGPHTVNTNGNPNGVPVSSGGGPSGVSSIIVDDMFLSLENAFSDDFEKMKRLASEVQQYCSSSTPGGDYSANDVMMQLSPATTAPNPQLQQLHSPNTNNTAQQPQPQTQQPPPPPPPPIHLQTTAVAAAQQQQQQLQQQQQRPPLKPNISATSSRLTTGNTTGSGSSKSSKKYKRSAAALHQHNNNNNNPNVINHNNSPSSGGNLPNAGSAPPGSNSNSATNANTNGSNTTGGNGGGGGSGSSNSSNSPTHCNGQRKERSLHYCSICSKGFKDKYSVNVHIRTHTGEKPFACSLCGKSFRQKAHLAKHYQTHMAQKNNGSIVKGGGSASKHHRSSGASVAAAAAGSNTGSNVVVSGGTGVVSSCGSMAMHQRQLGSLASITAGGGGVRSATGVLAGGIGGPLNGPVATVGGNVLPPANGLLANR